MSSRSEEPAWASAASQSIADPSAIDSTSFISRSDSPSTFHFLSQSKKRAVHGHPRGVG